MAQTSCVKTDPTNRGQQYVLIPDSPNTNQVKRTVSGTVLIVDGCNFQVSAFQLQPPGHDVYWYGIPKGQPKVDENKPNQILLYPKISGNGGLASYDGQTINFALTKVSWSDMDGIGLYSEADKVFYAKAMWVPDTSKSDGSGVATSYAGIGVIASMVAVLALVASI